MKCLHAKQDVRKEKHNVNQNDKRKDRIWFLSSYVLRSNTIIVNLGRKIHMFDQL